RAGLLRRRARPPGPRARGRGWFRPTPGADTLAEERQSSTREPRSNTAHTRRARHTAGARPRARNAVGDAGGRLVDPNNLPFSNARGEGFENRPRDPGRARPRRRRAVRLAAPTADRSTSRPDAATPSPFWTCPTRARRAS